MHIRVVALLPITPQSKVIKKKCTDNNFFVHFWTPICKTGGVLFWREDIFPPKMVLFYNKKLTKIVLVNLICHTL